jgi:hypothetical protein
VVVAEGIAQIKLAPLVVQAAVVATVTRFLQPQAARAQLTKDMPVVPYRSMGLVQAVAALVLLAVMGRPL